MVLPSSVIVRRAGSPRCSRRLLVPPAPPAVHSGDRTEGQCGRTGSNNVISCWGACTSAATGDGFPEEPPNARMRAAH